MATTQPNGGIPAFRKKPAAFDAEPTGGHAAGVLYVAPDGDVLLLRRSSTEENYAGHWALPGGKAEDGETPEQAAHREAGEEIGGIAGATVGGGVAPMKLLDRRATPNGMTFHTFARPIEEKFAPKLNGEHSGYAWAPLDMLPQPLHPAVEKTLAERVRGGAQDMTPEDWSGLRDGFVKWTREEEDEAEHLTGDSALRLALDRDSVRDFGRDGQLRVKVANVSKATVNPYLGKEIPDGEKLGLEPDKVYHLLRDPEEIRKGAATLNGVPLLRKHIPVSAADHQPHDVVGSMGTDADFDGTHLKNSLFVNAQDAIDGIVSGKKRELSAGYHYRPDMTPGIFNDMRYDGVMRDIVFNHVALVEDGRAGPDVVVGDSNEEIAMAGEAKKIDALAKRMLTVGMLAAYAKPILAQDARLDMASILEGVTGKNFATKKPEIAKRFATQVKSKKAKIATDESLEKKLDGVEKVLDLLGKYEGEEGTDESVSKEQHNAMEAAAHGASNLDIPAAVGEEFVDKDKDKSFDAEPMKAFLKEKGMGEDDIAKVCDMLPKPAAMDEDDDETKKKAKEKEEADKKDAADKAAKDAEMKDMVTKPAMDAAIRQAVDATAKSVRENERSIRTALDEVRPYVGELSPALAFDSGHDVIRHALVMKGVDGAKTLHNDALRAVLAVQPKIGARPAEVAKIGMDSAAASEFGTMFADAGRIKAA